MWRIIERPVGRPYLLQGFELATSLVFGKDPAVSPLAPQKRQHPRKVLESIVRRALERPPCVVGFSGGRDSAALLAVAAHLARREGLDPPVAVTNVFPGDMRATEDKWQEEVLEHLRVKNWDRIVITSELDVIGPEAIPLLRRFGPTFPFNGHFVMPILRAGAGGSCITGVGGDEIFEPTEMVRVGFVVRGLLTPKRRDFLLLALFASPASVRRRFWRQRIPAENWLRPGANAQLLDELASVMANQRARFDGVVRHDIWRDRARVAVQQTLSTFAEMRDAVLVQPFFDPDFLDAVAFHKGRIGWPNRAAAMDELFGDLLPRSVIQRNTKAVFDNVFFHDHCRAFVRDWDGSGVDPEFVDVAALRSCWSARSPDPRSLSLLQATWLDGH